MDLPKIKVPLILGIWGGKGQGKTFQCTLAYKKLGITPIVMSAGELESGNAGEPAKLVRPDSLAESGQPSSELTALLTSPVDPDLLAGTVPANGGERVHNEHVSLLASMVPLVSEEATPDGTAVPP